MDDVMGPERLGVMKQHHTRTEMNTSLVRKYGVGNIQSYYCIQMILQKCLFLSVLETMKFKSSLSLHK